MSLISRVGHPCEYNREDHDKIVEEFGKTIVLSNVAGIVRRDKDTIKRWLAKGKADLNEGNSTEISQFYVDVKNAIAKTVRALEDRLLHGEEKNWQRIAWYLERCAREDYGADAGIIEEILEEFKKMKEAQEAINGAR